MEDPEEYVSRVGGGGAAQGSCSFDLVGRFWSVCSSSVLRVFFVHFLFDLNVSSFC